MSFELQVLGDFLSDSSISAGNLFRPSALDGDAELDSDEVAEVVFIEVVPPVTGGGTVEDLENIRLLLDGKEHPFINLLGTDDFLTNPVERNMLRGNPVRLGVPLVDAVANGDPLLTATCPKYKDAVRIQAQAGDSGITANFRIRLWGFKYDVDQLNFLFGDTIGGQLSINDRRRQRVLRAFKTPIAVSQQTWTQLPGGQDQSVPKVNTLFRYSRNANATTANIPYQFRADNNNVDIEEQNLRFEFDRFNEALLVQNFGINAPANLSESFINIDGDDFPESRIPTTENLNPIHFGRGEPLLPADIPLYHDVKPFEKPVLVWDEIAYVAAQDDGTSVPADSINVAIKGIRIEMGNG